MVCKLELYGKIRVVTGLHIGGAKAFSAIGAVDSTVIRDSSTHLPMIPGSSLKGKTRTLLQRMKQDGSVLQNGWDSDRLEVKRLFGGKIKKDGENQEKILFGRLQFFDCFVSESDQTKDLVEVKAENTITRLTSVANPRSMERVNRGIHFDFKLGYDMPFDEDGNPMYEEIAQDFANINNMMQLLESDYLGGSGSRGYGRIAFEDLELKKRFGSLPEKYSELETKVMPWDAALKLMEESK